MAIGNMESIQHQQYLPPLNTQHVSMGGVAYFSEHCCSKQMGSLLLIGTGGIDLERLRNPARAGHAGALREGGTKKEDQTVSCGTGESKRLLCAYLSPVKLSRQEL